MSKNSLADKIASLLTAAPVNVDPEDENVDNTNAKLNYENAEETLEDIPIQSQIRKQNIDFLEDIDERYAGKKGSRKNLNSDEEISSDDEKDYNLNNIDEEASSSNEDESVKSDYDDDDDSTNSNDEDGSANSDNDQDAEEYLGDSDQEDETNFKTLNDDVPIQVKKGKCVKNQMSIWENFLEIRIQIQKCLIAANKMPQNEKYKEIKNESGQEFSEGVRKAKQSVSLALEKFLLLQSLLWKQYPEMKKFKVKQSDSNIDNDEEIPSDTEDEMNEEDDEEEKEDENNQSPKKKMKLSDFEKDIQDKHDIYKEYRNSVIQKWYDKTRLPVMKNNTTAHSIINHIGHTLADKEKLVKKTQLKRTDYKIIGEDNEENNDINADESHQDEYNAEIFDDNDFYHHLLRELIEVKSADLTDPVQLGRQWIKLQNLRGKMKRKIDTKATKGRKIRYAIHTKLVNFMAPIDNNSWSDQAKTELFGSLFGKGQSLAS